MCTFTTHTIRTKSNPSDVDTAFLIQEQYPYSYGPHAKQKCTYTTYAYMHIHTYTNKYVYTSYRNSIRTHMAHMLSKHAHTQYMHTCTYIHIQTNMCTHHTGTVSVLIWPTC
jgi:hypothetical protein